MILTKTVEVIISPSNFNHFKALKYENLKCKEKITVPVDHLPKGSGYIIHIKCDCKDCKNEIDTEYGKYIGYLKNQGFYTCVTCCVIKTKKTNLERLGVEYPGQSEEVKEKMKQTNLKNLGCKYPFQSKEVKEKIKQTNLKNLGVEYASQNESFKEKVRQTNLKNLGVEYTMQSKNVRKKARQTNR